MWGIYKFKCVCAFVCDCVALLKASPPPQKILISKFRGLKFQIFRFFFNLFWFVWMIFDIFYTYSIHRKSIRVREKKHKFSYFTIVCVCHSLGILSKSSNSILKNGLLLKRVCFFLRQNFIIIIFYSFVLFF